MARSLFSNGFLILCLALNASSQTFTEASLQAGIEGRALTVTMIGGGCAFFDYDNDGWLDIYMVGGLNYDKLYHNNGDGTFTERTFQAGFGITAYYYTMGVVTGDIDNDGYRDVFVTTLGMGQSFHNTTPNLLFRNNRNGTFTDISQQAGINDSSWSVSATMGDYNLDGYLDIYVVNYVDSLCFIEDSITRDIIGYCHKGLTNFLYLNNGNGTFANVGPAMQVNDRATGLATTFTDYDNDHDMDIFAVNDFGAWVTPNRLYQNNFPANSFTNVSAASGANVGIYGMGIAPGDYDEDGDLDYYFTNIGENVLLNNSGSGTFANAAATAGVANGRVDTLNSTAWGCAFLDYDNDTRLDLFVADGYISAADFIATSEKDPKKLFRNNGNGTFTDVSVLEGVNDSSKGRGLAMGDYDNDGDIDVLVMVAEEDTAFANDEHVLLFRNDNANGNHWLKVKLQGTQSNRDGFGSRVEVYRSGRKWIREIDGGLSAASQNSSIAHFGLGSYASVDSIVVIWPGGRRSSVANVASNQTVTIIESGSAQTVIHRSIEICDDDSVFAAGAWRKTSGTYYDTLASSSVDTIVVTSLQVNPAKVTTFQFSICEGDSMMLGGSYRTASGVFNDTLQTSKGCDSIIVSELTVTPLQVAIADVFLCAGDSIFAAGAWQTEGGAYYDTVLSSPCSDVVITSVYVFPFVPDTVYVMICEGDSFFAGGAWRTSAGSFFDSLHTSFGCDSVMTTKIELILHTASNRQANICAGDSTFIAGAWQKVPGVYYDTVLSATGCDSIIATTLDVIEGYTSFDSVSITAGDSAYLAGAWQTMPGTYREYLVAAGGCDSIIITELIVLTGIEYNNENAARLSVYPNPSRSGFTVSYSIPADDDVEITVCSASGKMMASLTDGRQAAGNHAIQLTERSLEAGVYFLSFRTSGYSKVVKVIVF